ncbi:hypothetical protein REJ26_002350 [Providencia stuartii]|uniref:hypothetical protein n=1 Tax=Providencia TaxID=586 RepID=UPI0027EBE061|nr:hypothetical protein [Providencia sp. 2023EL-00965]ELR5300715.1 hypothetical protein [Providencia stuartii]MDW7589662.1 hypothetical protein [Providencia sp. 2023EL-00965]
MNRAINQINIDIYRSDTNHDKYLVVEHGVQRPNLNDPDLQSVHMFSENRPLTPSNFTFYADAVRDLTLGLGYHIHSQGI